MDYSQLSDFEINLKVAHIALGKGSYDWSSEKKEVYSAGIDGGEFLPNGYFDPCNNPADAWPIIVGKKLSLINADDKWLCVPEDEPVNGVTGDAVHMIYSGDGVEHENPLRAAMIVFLMMQDSASVPTNSTGSDIR
ncbi:DUF2591 family protein [Citrobacter freundii]|uniref:phage protein NinX family protein n=1 Tax=Citrobacter freundii TaxID=546 RepID=UPI001906384D|nr:phage protein NinX family protein [Citrobacter freundii]MBJ8730897.1 DUF2591 family protein [Citrobacter freundii]